VWRVIQGGSREYVRKLVAGHQSNILLDSPVESVTRMPDSVVVRARGWTPETYDAVFLACHSDQALRMLTDPSKDETEVLGAIRYQDNHAILHTDDTLMPKRQRAWASWNYHIGQGDSERVTLTYHMNRLQRLATETQYFVTLNSDGEIDPSKIIREVDYAHPVFTSEAVAAQGRKHEIDGANRTYFCGAYWRYGFHEDGVMSALSALERFETEVSDAQQHLRRAS